MECIHTDSDCYGLNSWDIPCTAHFKPEGAYNQPACECKIGNGFHLVSIFLSPLGGHSWTYYDHDCSREMSFRYFMESIGEHHNRFWSYGKVDQPASIANPWMGGEPGNLGKGLWGTYWVGANKESPYGKADDAHIQPRPNCTSLCDFP